MIKDLSPELLEAAKKMLKKEEDCECEDPKDCECEDKEDELEEGRAAEIAVAKKNPPKAEKTKFGWQVMVYSPTTKGYIAQGQPHKTEAAAKKDAKNFIVEDVNDWLEKVMNEESPPDEDIKKWLEDADVQSSFKKQYGDKYKEIMFGKAWNMYNDKGDK